LYGKLLSKQRFSKERKERSLLMNVNRKKLVLTVLVFILMLSTLAASGTSKTGTINFGEDTDVSLGRAGLVFTNSQYDATVRLTRVNRNNLPGTNAPKFTQHLISTRLTNAAGEKVTHVIGPVYVYFKVRGPETRLWNRGELTIYYYDTWLNKWTECPTHYIFKAGQSRVSCRVRAMGTFGVGEK